MKRLQGLSVSKGLGRGKLVVIQAPHESAARHKAKRLPPEERKREVQRFRTACRLAKEEITALADRLAERAPEEAEALAAQVLMLEDDALVGSTEQLISHDGLPAEAALERTAEQLALLFEEVKSDYLRERASDLKDVVQRLQRKLSAQTEAKAKTPGPVVLAAEELLPSHVAAWPREQLHGLVSAKGSATSHAAIIARALEVPAVFGVPGLLAEARPGVEVLVDGERGEVVIEPDEAELAAFQRRVQELPAALEALQGPVHTKDGVAVKVEANVGSLVEVEAAIAKGADGVGVFRTELLFLQAETLPDAEAQYALYRRSAELLAGRTLTLRALDAGADKPLPALHLPPEPNPALGLRGLRFLLENPDVFKPQVEAMLRVARDFPVRILLPMVATCEEFEEGRAFIAEIAAELGVENVPVGAMVEIPSLALVAEEIAERADFLSVGTNDLMQYLFAADRSNPALAGRYPPTHPALAHLLEGLVAAGEKAGIPVAVCGEIAGQVELLPYLLQLGVRELSLSPANLPAVKHAIREFSLED